MKKTKKTADKILEKVDKANRHDKDIPLCSQCGKPVQDKDCTLCDSCYNNICEYDGS